MRINHNVAALNTYSRLTSANEAQSKSLEKLSSGLRINKAGDDAAGLAISEKMRGQIRGLDQASRNAQDSISMIQTAEGALNETQSILQRMRELAVQSANDTNVAVDRTAIQQEVNQLRDEIDRIGNTTEFNTKKLLNGSATIAATSANGSAATCAQDSTALAALKIIGGTGDTTAASTFTFRGSTIASADNAATACSVSATSTLASAGSLTINGVGFNFSTTTTYQQAIDTINNAGIGVTASLSGGTTGFFTLTSNTVGSASNMTATGTGAFGAACLNLGAVGQGADATLTAVTGGVQYSTAGNTVTVQSGAAKGLSFEISKAFTGTCDTSISVNSNGGLYMHIGANEDQNMYISMSDMRSAALGVQNIDITSQTNANSAITTINNAITAVSTERSKLGAYQNRLEHTINNLSTSSENLTASESRIRDVDMAKEMMEFTKNNILNQASTAMLAQANQQPQGVLQLLK